MPSMCLMSQQVITKFSMCMAINKWMICQIWRLSYYNGVRQLELEAFTGIRYNTELASLSGSV